MNNDTIKQFIEREIEKIPDLYSPMVYESGDVWMFCPFHDPENIHQAVKRTLKINLSNPEFPYGTFVCFACYGETPVEQAGKGNWNKLAKRLGLKSLSPSEMYNDRPREITKEIKSNLGIKEEVKERIDVVVNDVATVKWHANENWRTIKGMLLRKIDARKGINEKTDELILILPVVMHDYVQGKVYCRIKKRKR